MVSINPDGTLRPIPSDLPDRSEARRTGNPRYKDTDHPCKKCGDPSPSRYTVTDDCIRCLNTRPRGR